VTGFEGLHPITDHYWMFHGLLLAQANIPGDIAEFGVFNGGSTRQLAALAPNRVVWAFDTYSGMPRPEFNPTLDHDYPGKFKPDAPLNALFTGIPNIQPVMGRFCDTLGLVPPDIRFAFVYMDCDLYESYRQVLEWLAAGRLTNPSVLLCDDYDYCKGATRAVDEWVAKHSLTLDRPNKIVYWKERQ
jgi:O-methyltransferase